MFLKLRSPIADLRSHSPLANKIRFNAMPEYYARRDEVDPLADLPVAVKTVPLAVLIDEATASGAELVAGILKQNERAILVGRVTQGIASIQTISMLPNGGAIKYTSAIWELPYGTRVDGVGVSPHEVVEDKDHAAAIERALSALAADRSIEVKP
jgi:carboxyl-terminal processing protease